MSELLKQEEPDYTLITVSKEELDYMQKELTHLQMKRLLGDIKETQAELSKLTEYLES